MGKRREFRPSELFYRTRPKCGRGRAQARLGWVHDVAVLPQESVAPPSGRALTIVANLRREEIDELISTLESLDAVGGRHLKITVRDGFEIGGIPEHMAPRLSALLSELGVEHYTVEKSPVHVSGCHHLFDCPRDLVGTESLSQRMAHIIDDSGVEGVLLDSVKGQVDPRSRLKVAVAGCTSCCNAPQVQDFGVMAKERPKTTSTPCEAGCKKCVEVCEDNAIALVNSKPIIDMKKCIDCGQCVRACPTGTIVAEKSGFEIFEGGHLGRDPKVGVVAKDWATWTEVEERLRKAMRDITELMGPIEPAGVEIKPSRVHLPGPSRPMAHAAGEKFHVPEPPRLKDAD
jgi:dissimilatory sulfite reductase (desulfoviridin) alpha/beta subunit